MTKIIKINGYPFRVEDEIVTIKESKVYIVSCINNREYNVEEKTKEQIKNSRVYFYYKDGVLIAPTIKQQLIMTKKILENTVFKKDKLLFINKLKEIIEKYNE